MMTENNFFTHIQKWSVCKADTTEPPKFSDWECFKNGFLEMLKRVEPSKICWYDKISGWVNDYYNIGNIIVMKKRHKAAKEREFDKMRKTQPCLA